MVLWERAQLGLRVAASAHSHGRAGPGREVDREGRHVRWSPVRIIVGLHCMDWHIDLSASRVFFSWTTEVGYIVHRYEHTNLLRY
jgi:hypothetical protein